MLSFNQLATSFQEIEATTGRLRLVALLADLLAQATPEEIGPVCYLLQGRVAPFYEPIEFGLGEKSIAAAIARAYGVEREQVLAEYGRVGDLGIAAQDLAEATHAGGRELSIPEVFDGLRELAHLAGAGSIDAKISAFSDLLTGLAPLAARYLVRIPAGAARLGVGDVTILSALAQARLGDAKLRGPLEEAYNRTSDLGLIAGTLFEHGVEAVQALGVFVQRPIRPQLAERLPDAETILAKLGGRVHIQMKFDGMRVQIHLDRGKPDGEQVRLYSRSLEDMTSMFPEIVAAALEQVKATTAILDSETLAFNPLTEEFLPFQETTRRRRKHNIAEMQNELPLRAIVFDAMYRDGQALLDLPLTERLRHLSEMVQADGVLRAEPGQVIDDADKMRVVFEEALTEGLEGLVVKRLDSTYQAGARNFNWVKLKKHSAGALEDTVDTVLLGYIFGRGKRAELGVGALLVGVYDKEADEFATISKVGTGLSDQQWRDIRERSQPFSTPTKPARVRSLITPSVWLEPEIVLEILADEITRSPNHTAGMRGAETGFALRFPRLVRIREADKRPEDATTVREIEEMFANQYASRTK